MKQLRQFFLRRFVRQDQYTTCRLSVASWFFARKPYVIRTLLLCDWSVQQTASKTPTQLERNVVRMWAAVSLGGAFRDIPKKRLRRRLGRGRPKRSLNAWRKLALHLILTKFGQWDDIIISQLFSSYPPLGRILSRQLILISCLNMQAEKVTASRGEVFI